MCHARFGLSSHTVDGPAGKCSEVGIADGREVDSTGEFRTDDSGSRKRKYVAGSVESPAEFHVRGRICVDFAADRDCVSFQSSDVPRFKFVLTSRRNCKNAQ